MVGMRHGTTRFFSLWAVALGAMALWGCTGQVAPEVADTPYPSLATVPDRPRPMTPAQRELLIDALEADRAKAGAIEASVANNPEAPAAPASTQ